MKILEKLKRLFMVIEKNDNFYHECGHVIISKIFEETLIVEFVTLELATTKMHDVESLGGLKAKFAIPVSNLSIYDHDKAILSMLAGLCVDDINNNNGIINSSFYEIQTWANKFNEPRYEGDIELVISNFNAIKSTITLSWQEYISTSLKFLYGILNDNRIWETITVLRKHLKESTNHTLDNKQIDEIIIRTKFPKWVSQNKVTILKQRKNFLEN